MGDIRSLNRLASAQAGVLNIRQVRLAGFTRSGVHYRLDTGQWARLDDSVCAVAAFPDTWERRQWAAVLSRERAALTHWTACRLFGMSDVPAHQPTILVPRGSNTRSAIARVFESDQFDRIATTRVDGLPVTTMPETVLVLARDVERDLLTRVLDQSIVMGILDLRAMSQTIDREAGRRTPGTPILRRLTASRLPTAPSKSSTYLNRLLEIVLGDPRVPPWTREHEFSLDGIPSRVDVFIAVARLVIEADGRNWHSRWENMESDRTRDNALAARGIQVLRYTYEMLTKNPEKCLGEILATCRLRAA